MTVAVWLQPTDQHNEFVRCVAKRRLIYRRHGREPWSTLISGGRAWEALGSGILLYTVGNSGFANGMELEPPLAGAPQPKTSSLAIWSLVLGCLGIVLLLVCIGPVFAIPAVICGHLAYSRIRRSTGALSGQGLALAGLITGYIGIALAVLSIPMMLAIAVPNFTRARQAAQVNLCINNLRMIDSAKQTCALEKKLTAEDTPTADDLKPYLRQDFKTLRCPAGGSYSINKIGEAPTCTIPNHVLPTAPGRQ